MRLTPNFTLDELTLSETAVRQGIPNDPDDKVVENLKRLAGTLEQVRTMAGCPIMVSSGYRSPLLNQAVRGSRNSAHVLGLAADINAAQLDPRALARMIANSELRFDQCILEFDRWVHVGLATGTMQPRREVLTAQRDKAGRVLYLRGIV